MSDSDKTFDELGLKRQFLRAIEDQGYEKPTPIQSKAIPLINSGHDLFGVAQTGTGKTAAFLLPILEKLKFPQGNDPRTVILAPTRELAIQIGAEAEKLIKYTELRLLVAYGGVGPKTQAQKLEEGVDILIGTPGRIHDLYLRGHLIFKHIKIMVLDEADRMMDMGFMPQIRKLLEVIPSKRQNLLFSATMPEKVVRLSEEFLENPLKIEVTPQATAAETVTQKLYHIPNFKTKINLLGYLLKPSEENEFKRVLIFTRTKAHADNVGKYLVRKVDDNTRVIHANKGQNSRINAIESFKAGEVRILVSTDVAARGIDIADVSHVINFDVPILYEDYVHRIGRTGRAFKKGVAITFCHEAEAYHIKKIEDLIRSTIPVEEIPEAVEVEKTPFEEGQIMARELDQLRRKDDPDFKGAFHEKKARPKKPAKKDKKRGGKGKKRR